MEGYYAAIILGLLFGMVGVGLVISYSSAGFQIKRSDEAHIFLGRIGLVLLILGFLVQLASNFLH